jgi:Holliday junction resolvase RusA-like endonuclease
LLPFDFIIIGPPRSLQADRKKLHSYRELIQDQAHRYLSEPSSPYKSSVAVVVTHFYRGPTRELDGVHNNVDVDNMLKPIVDALKGVAYVDDKQVVDVRGTKKWLSGEFFLERITRALADGFVAKAEFVHIKVCLPPDHRELP